MGDIPELKANLIGILEDTANNSILITFENLLIDDAKAYVEEIKALGYGKGMEGMSADSITFSGYRDNKTEIAFLYSSGNNSGSIVYITDSMSAESVYSNVDDEPTDIEVVEQTEEEPEEIDMTDDVPWPEDFMGDIPELEGKIVGINKNEGYVGIDLEYVEKEIYLNYIETIKELGFNVEPYESMSGDHISYEAYNDKDEYILTNWDLDGYAYVELSKP